MNGNGQSNLDGMRLRIMQLENSLIYDDEAWQKVLADLRASGRECALADAERRKAYAQSWQVVAVPALFVAAETEG